MPGAQAPGSNFLPKDAGMNQNSWIMALALILLTAIVSPAVHGQTATHEDSAEGLRLFRTNCAGCHRWHGGGGGGYGGDALSLRRTKLDRAQIIEVIGCGRPGTGMPFHLRDAYNDGKCYGLSATDVSNGMVREAKNFLRPNEIEIIADYVIANVKGRGEPSFAECQAFFGTGSRACNVYKSQQTAGQ